MKILNRTSLTIKSTYHQPPRSAWSCMLHIKANDTLRKKRIPFSTLILQVNGIEKWLRSQTQPEFICCWKLTDRQSVFLFKKPIKCNKICYLFNLFVIVSKKGDHQLTELMVSWKENPLSTWFDFVSVNKKPIWEPFFMSKDIHGDKACHNDFSKFLNLFIYLKFNLDYKKTTVNLEFRKQRTGFYLHVPWMKKLNLDSLLYKSKE